MFQSKLPLALPTMQSKLFIDDDTTKQEMLQYAIGQGDTLMTPMHMNLITQAIANDGILMEPMILDKVINNRGIMVKDFKTEEFKQLMTTEETAILKEFMKEVVDSGTAKGLQSELYNAAGKTGSAEFMESSKDSHAWFTGFAPYDKPQICVTVLVEGGGSGSRTAVPIAKKILDVYFERLAY